MRAKGILVAALAGGILLLAPGFEGARADGNHGHKHSYKHSQLQAFKGHGHRYGWHGQRLFGDHRDGGHAYGKRARKHFGNRLSSRDRKKLSRLRKRFDNERAFRRYLRHNKPGLFGRYAGRVQPRHHHRGKPAWQGQHQYRRNQHGDGHRRIGAQVWYEGPARWAN